MRLKIKHIIALVFILVFSYLFFKSIQMQNKSNTVESNKEVASFDIELNDNFFKYNNYTFNYFLVAKNSPNKDNSLFLIDNLNIEEFSSKLKDLNYAESNTMSLYSILNRDDYSRGDTVDMKISVNGKLYSIDELVLNNSNEKFTFKYNGTYFTKDSNIYSGEVVNLVSDPISLISNCTFVAGYDKLKKTEFKVNLNLLNPKNNKFKMIIYKNKSVK